MSGSAIAAALSALDALWKPVGAANGIEVVSRRPYDPQRRFLAVAWDPSGQSPAAMSSRTNSDYGMARAAESVDVTNLLSFWSGKDSVATVEDDVFAAFDLFDNALTTDHRLGGAVALAQTTDLEYMPDFRPEGALAQIRFTVHIDAWS